MKPMPKMTMPARTMPCDPNRSTIQPSTGPSSATSVDLSAAAPEMAVLLQPRSSTRTAT